MTASSKPVNDDGADIYENDSHRADVHSDDPYLLQSLDEGGEGGHLNQHIHRRSPLDPNALWQLPILRKLSKKFEKLAEKLPLIGKKFPLIGKKLGKKGKKIGKRSAMPAIIGKLWKHD